jgi:hypothetical protein
LGARSEAEYCMVVRYKCQNNNRNCLVKNQLRIDGFETSFGPALKLRKILVIIGSNE